MTSDRRAALVEKVARAISNPNGFEDNWKFWTGEAEIAVDLILAEVLEEAAFLRLERPS
jgi:hypothetical protein